MNDTPKLLTLPEPIINSVLQYLGTQPYVQVYQLIQAIQAQAKPIEAKHESHLDTPES